MLSPAPKPKYLGDGCYTRFDGYHIWLLTGSHDHPDNEVALEWGVFTELLDYAEKCWGIKITINPAEPPKEPA